MDLASETRQALPDLQEKADRMFLDGFGAERLDAETVLVRDPEGRHYRLNTLFLTCTCQSSAPTPKTGPCVHLLGFERLLAEQQAYEEAQVAALEEQYDLWGMTLENDRLEREVREAGFCPF